MFDSISQFRVKTNLPEKENCWPGDPACQLLSKPSKYPRSRVLRTSFQADGRSVKGEKKDTVLMISMTSPEEGGLSSLQVHWTPICAFRLGALTGLPVASERECISRSLRKANPKEKLKIPHKKKE